MDSLTILGGGNTAFSVAANLTHLGHRITLWEIPSFEHTLDPIRDANEISLVGVAEQGPAKIHRLTTDIAEALDANDFVLVIVPSYAHEPFLEACAPHLKVDHTVVLMPGNLGSLAWSHRLREIGAALKNNGRRLVDPYAHALGVLADGQ